MTAVDTARLVALGAIWGASFAFVRASVEAFGPIVLIELRLSLAAALLAVVAVWTRRTLKRANWRHHALVGTLNSAVPFLLFAHAALVLPASLLSLFNALAPLMGALVARVWLKTALAPHTLLGLALGFAGVAALGYEGATTASLDHGLAATLLALGAALLAPFLYGIAATYIKWRAANVTPFENAHGAMWAAALVVLPLAILSPHAFAPAPGDWAAAAALGFVCTGAAYLLNFRLIADLGPTRALTVTYLIPLFGTLWGTAFLGETLGLGFALGAPLVLAGTWLAQSAKA